MKRPRALAKDMGEYGPLLPATRSGRAELVTLDDADARQLAAGDTLFTPWLRGTLLTVVVEKVHTGAAGEDGGQYEVPVVDVTCQPAGVPIALAFAPGDLLHVSVRRGKAAA